MGIRILRQSATVGGLAPQGHPARSVSEPACRLGTLEVPLAGAGANECGLWECTPGRFARQVEGAEVMHLLAGAGNFTPIGGEPLAFRAGDTLFFPAHTTGVWDIRETVRKVFVVMPAA